ncbi:MAG: type transport system permease protein [Chloroflexota bacterium]|jgi:ABC-2 type transport system permease protein|nr:type transport system permease protein [Chloroflexota bacterium]
MSARRILALTRRLLQQFRRDHRTLALVFVAPIVILSLVSYLLRGDTTGPKVDLVVEDSAQAAMAVAAEVETSSEIAVTRTDIARARDDLENNRISGYIRLPAGFSERVTRERVVAPEVTVQGDEPGPAETVVKAVQSATGAATTTLVQGQSPRLEPAISYRYGGPSLDTLDYFGSAFIVFIVFFVVYVVTSVAFLRERTQGTLERLMASPLRRLELVFGYMLGFSILALLQSAVVMTYSLAVLHIHNAGNPALMFVVVAVTALMAVNLGIMLSTFARTEFQAVQFIPLVITPQAILAGIIVPISSEPAPLQVVSNVLPLTYAAYAMRDVMIRGAGLDYPPLLLALGVIAAFAALLIVTAGATVRRTVG